MNKRGLRGGWNGKTKCEVRSAKCEVKTLRNPKSILVYGDEGKLRQILMNLLSNAVKFTESGGVTLKIHEARMTKNAARPTDHAIRNPKSEIRNLLHISRFTFHVIDTGVGIPSEEQTLIFQPFTQGTSGVQSEGTGLGLAIVHKYAQLMGGELAVESSVGQGSRFSFNLPLQRLAARSQVRDAGRKIVRLAEGHSIRALVADDNRENREVLSRMLSAIGVSVIAAEDGGQALERVMTHRPDVVFIDIRMPVMDGIEVTQRILKEAGRDSGFTSPKMVAVSASALIHERQGYFDVGFDDFIAKPVRAERIYESLAQLLHIEYEVAEDEAPAMDISDIMLPEDLFVRLREAAEFGRVTELDKAFHEVEQTGEQGVRLAKRLRALSRSFDMEGILELLETLGQ